MHLTRPIATRIGALVSDLGGIATVRPLIRRWMESVLWTVYPSLCRCCEQPLGLSQVPYLCDDCWDKIPWISPPYCDLCGCPLPSQFPFPYLCHECERNPAPFRSRSLAVYAGALREAIHLLKYENKRVFCKHFDRLIEDFAPYLAEAGPYAGVLAIPLHKRRYRERGFNQSELIARSVANHLAVPLLQNQLRRTRHTRPQSALSTPSHRRQNIRGAFAVSNPEGLKGQRLLLVDDIHTTGATLREAIRVLREAGAAEVVVFTLARA